MPRASAAALRGSGFDPASGGQTTAAIASPASSRRLSTCSANAACPTRRTRIPGSALEVRREEALQALPRVARRLRLVGGALVAEEAMVCTRIDDHLGLLAGAAVEVRREGDVALGGDPPRDVLDVPVQPEGLLDDDYPGRACRRRRAGEKARHPARRANLDHLRLHIHQGAAPFRGSTRPR